MSAEQILQRFGLNPRFEIRRAAQPVASPTSPIASGTIELSGEMGSATQQSLLILDLFLGADGVLDEVDFAQSLQKRQAYGSLDSSDLDSLDQETPRAHADRKLRILTSVDPVADALRKWRLDACDEPSNSALWRASIVGALTSTLPCPAIVDTAAAYTSISHADPRCALASAVAAVLTVNLLTGTFIGDSTIAAAVKAVSNQFAQREPVLEYGSIIELSDLLQATDLSELELDTGPVSDVFKTLAAGIWALRQCALALPPHVVESAHVQTRRELFVHLVLSVAMQGGDTTANAFVSAGFLGAYLGGVDALPPQWVDGVQDGLRPKLNQAIQLLGLLDSPALYAVDEQASDYSASLGDLYLYRSSV